jgi:hypothetical protein
MLELVEQCHQVTEVAAETIKRGHGDQIEATTTGVGHERIETRPLLSGPADGIVGELREDHPAGTGSMLSEGAQLILGGLVARADATVQCYA